MATVTTSNFVPTTSLVNGASGLETRTNMGQLGLWNQSMTHNGLRSLSNLNLLRIRTRPSSFSLRVLRKAMSDNGSVGRIVCSQGMNLVFVGAEVGPWSKTGGLGDVLGGLPPAMAANGHRVMTVSPRYDQYKDAWDTSVLVEIEVGGVVETVRFFHCYKRGVDRVFVDHPWFLEKVWGKTGSKIYGPQTGVDYNDNQLRFSLLCQAALEAPRVLNLNSNKYFSGPYGEDVVFICNDWHTALLPCFLKTIYKPMGIYTSAKVAFCIHNIAYQGRFGIEDFQQLDLPDQLRGSFDFIDGYNKPVKGRKINWMKTSIYMPIL